jgi:hypothetical protein
MPPLTRHLLPALLALWACTTFARAVRADAGLHSYALVIGSNRGGDGQGQLAYAERDAERVAELLRELGRTPKDNISLLSEPSADDVQRVLQQLRGKLLQHAEAGERAQLLFYYSGHARARALSLGDEELPLETLRAALLGLPSTLTVVVLDACQSGAFSGVKGAAPAADFSISSVRDLHSTGVAVMASSTGTELSQESSELGSSYFTHHLLVSLRGAGDLDRNGRVSLDEAYSYAYQHTLSDTARTQVGSQHATLETELTGRGDVPLSYPVDADAQLALPSAVEGRVLVQRADGPVMAELVKARGGNLLLALPSGAYVVLLRGEESGQSCEVTLRKGQVHTLALASCKAVELPRERPKAANSELRRENEIAKESWFIEGGFTVGIERDDAYLRTLDEFGYHPQGGKLGFDITLGLQLSRHLSLVGRYSLLETGDTYRYVSEGASSFGWRTWSAMFGLRWRWPLASRWVVAFAELDAGIAFAHSELGYRINHEHGWSHNTHDLYDRTFAARGLAGFNFGYNRHFGMYLAAGYTYAPVLKNDLGQRHESGGITIVHGIRLNGVKGWW